MKPITISLSPNVQPDDLKIAWHTLLTPWRWSSHCSRIPDIEKRLATRLDQKFAILTSSGRTAIYHALKAHGVESGDEVIIQAFTCLAVPSAVKWAGATPIYADINPNTYNLDPSSVKKQITQRTKALIIQHTFGIPADLDQLLEIAAQHNLIVIEDLAHALGGSYNNQPLGSLGHTSILSFGRDKTISCIYGGAIVTSDDKVAANLRHQQTNLSNPSYWWSTQQLLHPILMSLIIPTYFIGSIGKAFLVIAQKLRLLSKAVANREKIGLKPNFINWSISPALLPLLENQLTKLDKFTNHRRQMAGHYFTAFPNEQLEQCLQSGNWLRFPIQVEHKRAVLKKVRAHHLLLGDWYSTPVTPSSLGDSDVTDYQPGSCPRAELAAQKVINLPTHINISRRDVDRVVTAVRRICNL